MRRGWQGGKGQEGYLRAIGKFSHEGDVVGGPGLIGQARVGTWFHLGLLRQLQHGRGDQGVVGVQDVIQRAQEVLSNVCELQATTGRSSPK